MAQTKRYDLSGKTVAGRTYPEGTILKFTDDQAKTMGLTSSDVSDVTLTSDDAAKARSYEDALTRQDEMREADLKRIAEQNADADAPAGNKKRTTK